MQAQPLFSFRNRWFSTSVIITAGIAVVAAGFGFLWLPLMERNTTFPNVWIAICTAAGLVQPAPSAGVIVQSPVRLSAVFLTPGGIAPRNAVAIGQGATLALSCSMCHGARGLSQANTPDLAGQYDSAVYKQLEDFRSGARVNAVMSPQVADMSEQDMRELTDFYAYLPRPPWPGNRPIPRIVESGAPMRGIAPCGACHGEIAHKLGTPRLEGEPIAYIRAQLIDFMTGERHNDINGIMRNIARAMTPQEIDASAQYYGVQP
jgi:cytochrome c553